MTKEETIFMTKYGIKEIEFYKRMIRCYENRIKEKLKEE